MKIFCVKVTKWCLGVQLYQDTAGVCKFDLSVNEKQAVTDGRELLYQLLIDIWVSLKRKACSRIPV